MRVRGCWQQQQQQQICRCAENWSAVTGGGTSRDSSTVAGPSPTAQAITTGPTITTNTSTIPSTLNQQLSSAPPRRPSTLNPEALLLPQRQHFATSAAAMGATKLDGTAIAKSIRERLGAEIAEKQKLNPRYKPTLKIIQGTYLI
jgi:methylenetetrahydrofolate dehydrogenase (NADP+)/methenyltetrahydrofolate cyclohydrolase/formyltetrahydrofolate synthetase